MQLRQFDVSVPGEDQFGKTDITRDIDKVDRMHDWHRGQMSDDPAGFKSHDFALGAGIGGEDLEAHDFRTFDTVDYHDDWQRGVPKTGGLDASTEFVESAGASASYDFRKLEALDCDLEWQRGAKQDYPLDWPDDEAPVAGEYQEHDPAPLARNFEGVDRDFDWQRGVKGERAYDPLGPMGESISGPVSKAGFSLRTLDRVDPQFDWHQGGNRPKMLYDFGPDLDTGDREALKLRQLKTVDPQYDWLNPTGNDNIIQPLAPDLTPFESHPDQFRFRKLDRVDPDLDWQQASAKPERGGFDPLQESATSGAGHGIYRKFDKVNPEVDWQFGPNKTVAPDNDSSLAAQEPFRDKAKLNYRQTSQIDPRFDWHRGNPGNGTVWQDRPYNTEAGGEGQVKLTRSYARIDNVVDWRGSSKSDPKLDSYAFGPDLTVTPKGTLEYRKLSNLDQSVDWARSGKGETSLNSIRPDTQPNMHPSEFKLRELQNIDQTVDWQTAKSRPRHLRGPDGLFDASSKSIFDPGAKAAEKHIHRDLSRIDPNLDFRGGGSGIPNHIGPDLTPTNLGAQTQNFHASFRNSGGKFKASPMAHSKASGAFSEHKYISEPYDGGLGAVKNFKFRDYAKLQHGVDWQRASKRDKIRDPEQLLDLTPMAMHPAEFMFRELDKVQPGADWRLTGAGREGTVPWTELPLTPQHSMMGTVTHKSMLRDLDMNIEPRWGISTHENAKPFRAPSPDAVPIDYSDSLLAEKVNNFQFRSYDHYESKRDWNGSTQYKKNPDAISLAASSTPAKSIGAPKAARGAARKPQTKPQKSATIRYEDEESQLGPNTQFRNYEFRTFDDKVLKETFKIATKAPGIPEPAPVPLGTPEERLARFRGIFRTVSEPQGPTSNLAQETTAEQPKSASQNRADRLAARLAEAANIGSRRDDRRRRSSNNSPERAVLTGGGDGGGS